MNPDARQFPSATTPDNATQLVAALDLALDAAPPRSHTPAQERDLLREVADLKAAIRSGATRSLVSDLALKGGSGDL